MKIDKDRTLSIINTAATISFLVINSITLYMLYKRSNEKKYIKKNVNNNLKEEEYE